MIRSFKPNKQEKDSRTCKNYNEVTKFLNRAMLECLDLASLQEITLNNIKTNTKIVDSSLQNTGGTIKLKTWWKKEAIAKFNKQSSSENTEAITLWIRESRQLEKLKKRKDHGPRSITEPPKSSMENCRYATARDGPSI